MLRHVLRHERSKDPFAPPGDEMRGVRGVHHVGCIDTALIFLADTLKYALGTAALDAHDPASFTPAYKSVWVRVETR